jgi:heterodisulfide reductase subunit A
VDHFYCSSVCCICIKEAVIPKERLILETYFFMDMRTFGKDFELYYNRAKKEYGVRFIRSRIHSIDPVSGDNLAIRYADESGEEKTEVFDMIVLSVGMEVAGRQGADRPWGWRLTPMTCATCLSPRDR